MRRLLTWIAISITCTSILLVAIRVLHPDSLPTACIQLLSPTSGDVLTLDAYTGVVLFDARTAFPLPIIHNAYLDPLSPDQTHVIDAIEQTQTNPSAYKLWLRRRSTAHRRPLTYKSDADTYLWSPDSQYIVFTELLGWGGGNLLTNLVTTDVQGTFIQREAISIPLTSGWFMRSRQSLWSPDSTLLALPINQPQSPGLYFPNATVALRPVAADQSIYVPLPNQQIEFTSWSPDSQFIFVFLQDATSSHTVAVLQRDGQLLKQTALFPGFTPFFYNPSHLAKPEWSPDGQYFYLLSDDPDQTQLDVFSLHGDRMLPMPITLPHPPFMWTRQPHTLLYVTDHRTLEALDVTTGHITTLADHLADNQMLWFAPDAAALAVITSPAPNRIIPRLISLDLSQNTTPFGAVESQGDVTADWSPDNQTILLTTEEDAAFTIRWVQKASTNAQNFRFPKQGTVHQELSAEWLTNEIILLQHSTADSLHIFRLDTRTLTLTSLLSVPTTPGYTVAHRDAYIVITTRLGRTLYRLSDGVTLFSNVVSDRRALRFYVAPDERAALMRGGYDDSHRPPNLSLITATSNQLLATADDLTHSAWTPDSERFTFATIDKPNGNWTVSMMSRDGTLLHSFPYRLEPLSRPFKRCAGQTADDYLGQWLKIWALIRTAADIDIHAGSP